MPGAKELLRTTPLIIIFFTARMTVPKCSKSGFRETRGWVHVGQTGTIHYIGFKLLGTMSLCTTTTISNHLFLNPRQRDKETMRKKKTYQPGPSLSNILKMVKPASNDLGSEYFSTNSKLIDTFLTLLKSVDLRLLKAASSKYKNGIQQFGDSEFRSARQCAKAKPAPDRCHRFQT